MYSLYLTNELSGLGDCVYDNGLLDPEDKVIDPILELEDNTAGSEKFKIPITHSAYDLVTPMKTTVSVLRDREKIWEGRVLSVERDFYNNKSVTAEGALAYFNDSVQTNEKVVVNGSDQTTLSQYVQHLLTVHNSKVPNNRKIQYGEVDDALDYNEDTGSANRIVRYTEYDTTMAHLKNLVDDFEGHMYIKCNNGSLYFYYKKIDETTLTDDSQIIDFGVNLLDFTENTDFSEYASVIFPLGTTLDNDSGDSNIKNYLTLSGATIPTDWQSTYEIVDGKYLKHKSAVETYGWICVTERWDEAEDAQMLLKYAKDYLDSIQKKHTSIEIKMVDLHYLDPSVNALNMYDIVKTRSVPQFLNNNLMVVSMEIPFDEPSNTNIKLGAELDKPLSKIAASENSYLSSKINSIPDSTLKQNKTLTTPIEISGVPKTTVEEALQALNSQSQYVLPTASSSVLGGIKVGSRLRINSSTGVLSAVSQTDNNFTNADKTKLDNIVEYTLPTASSSVLGGIKVGSRLSINSSTGVLSANSQTDNNFTTAYKTILDNMVDEIIDEGTDSNGWEYIKFKNGYFMAWTRKTITGLSLVTDSSLYYSNFTSSPPALCKAGVHKYLFVDLVADGNYSSGSLPWIARALIPDSSSGSISNAVNIRAYATSSGPLRDSGIVVNMLVISKWK